MIRVYNEAGNITFGVPPILTSRTQNSVEDSSYYPMPMFMKNKFFLALVLVVVGCAFPLLHAQTNPSTMKAIVVHEFGRSEVLKYESAPKPEPKENEILVRVIAAGVNPVDDGLRSGHYSKYFGPKPPFTPGSDIAGVVEKNGANITKFKVGDGVYGFLDLDRGGG